MVETRPAELADVARHCGISFVAVMEKWENRNFIFNSPCVDLSVFGEWDDFLWTAWENADRFSAFVQLNLRSAFYMSDRLP